VDIRNPESDGSGEYVCGLARFIGHLRRNHQPMMLTLVCPSMDDNCRHTIGTEWRTANHLHMQDEHPGCKYRQKSLPDFNMHHWHGSTFYREERFWLDPEWLYERMIDTLSATRPNQKEGGWHTSYIALVLEQIEIYGIFGVTSGNVQQWVVEIYVVLLRRVTRQDSQHEVIGPWKWADAGHQANCYLVDPQGRTDPYHRLQRLALCHWHPY
jgi:hypothetical protein